MDPKSPNRSYLTPSPAVLKWITRAHRALYEKSAGLIGSIAFQVGEEGTSLLRRMDMLVLTTVGRKSGRERKVTLPYFQYDDRIFVIASNAASEKNPAWYLNLKSEPSVKVQLGPAKLAGRARPIEGEEYERYWRRHTAEWPRWKLYQDQTRRRIPMVEIIPGARDSRSGSIGD